MHKYQALQKKSKMIDSVYQDKNKFLSKNVSLNSKGEN